MIFQGCVLALTGKASDAIHPITSGITACRSTGATVWLPIVAIIFGESPCGPWPIRRRLALHRRSDCDDRNNQGKVVRGRGQSHCRGNRAACRRKRDAAKAEDVFRARPRRRPPTTSQILGTPRRHEPRAPLARPGQGAASARTARSGLRLVHGGLRHARSEGSEGVAGGVGVAKAIGCECRLLAHRVISRRRSNSVAFGAKKTFSEPRLVCSSLSLLSLRVAAYRANQRRLDVSSRQI